MPDPVELVGYLASGLIVVSLLMASVLRLRLINLAGSVTFTIYGLLIGAVPIVVANAAIVVINVVHLVRLWRGHRAARDLEVVSWPATDPYLGRFLAYHHGELARSQPGFAGVRGDHAAWVVLREAVPVGVVLARPEPAPSGDPHTVLVDLDYVVPAHRDLRPGRAVFGPDGPFASTGVRRVLTDPGSDAHRRYLERVGFAPVPGSSRLQRTIETAGGTGV